MKPEKQPTLPQAAAPAGQQAFRSAFYLLASIGAAMASLCLLGHKHTNRAIRTGIRTLPVLLPVLLEYRRSCRQEPKPAPPAQHGTVFRIGAYTLPIVLCLALGGLAGWLQRPALAEWYPTLLKSAATPPNVLFPIAWGIIYLLTGISAGRILTAPAGNRSEVTMVWGIQLGFNFLWSILFFVARSPLLGMIDIVALDALVMLYIAHSARIRRDAAWLFVPYLAWVLYATYLNARILALNGPGI